MSHSKLKTVLKENRGLFVFVVLLVCFRSAIADWNYVPTGSMEPTILPGDEVFVNKMAYDIRLPLTHISLHHRADPERGDIITFESEKADKRLVKRVIGVPGDEILLLQNRLFINGQAASYRQSAAKYDVLIASEQWGDLSHPVQYERQLISPLSDFGPVSVPEDYLLVLGDNRDNSADSRVYGLVPRSEVTGKVLRVIASLDIDDHFIPRKDRFFYKLP